MPELPQMQALAERLDAVLADHRFVSYQPLAFAALKTVVPAPEALVGLRLEGVGRRGKYLVATFEGELRLLVHLSQAGRVDLEDPPKQTRGKGGVVRFGFAGAPAVLVREFGTERKA